jgi:hypothetical protein
MAPLIQSGRAPRLPPVAEGLPPASKNKASLWAYPEPFFLSASSRSPSGRRFGSLRGSMSS